MGCHFIHVLTTQERSLNINLDFGQMFFLTFSISIWVCGSYKLTQVKVLVVGPIVWIRVLLVFLHHAGSKHPARSKVFCEQHSPHHELHQLKR